MNKKSLKARTLLLTALASFVLNWLLGKINTPMTDVLSSAMLLLGIITLVTGLFQLNREQKEKKRLAQSNDKVTHA